LERTEDAHVLGNGHAARPLTLTPAVCVSCGVVEVAPAAEPPGHLCAVCEAEQE
jgi:hypothetical protein